ncbi:MAG: DUF542 domain-containing protein [Polaribacter sp.]
MKTIGKKIVANIVTDNINTAKVFKKYKIDFGIDGHKNLSKICENQNIDLKKITKELKSIDTNVFFLKNYKVWKLDF